MWFGLLMYHCSRGADGMLVLHATLVWQRGLLFRSAASAYVIAGCDSTLTRVWILCASGLYVTRVLWLCLHTSRLRVWKLSCGGWVMWPVMMCLRARQQRWLRHVFQFVSSGTLAVLIVQQLFLRIFMYGLALNSFDTSRLFVWGWGRCAMIDYILPQR